MEEGEKASSSRYIALDIHKYYSVVAGVDREGKEVLPACRVEHVDLEDWLKKHLLPMDRVVIESTTNAWHVYDLLMPLVVEVLVANPIKVNQIACARVKTDKKDAFILARLLAANLAPTVWDATEARERTAAVGFTPAADGGDAYPGGEPDVQCGTPASSQPPEREGFSAKEHGVAAG
jgi:transposase